MRLFFLGVEDSLCGLGWVGDLPYVDDTWLVAFGFGDRRCCIFYCQRHGGFREASKDFVVDSKDCRGNYNPAEGLDFRFLLRSILVRY